MDTNYKVGDWVRIWGDGDEIHRIHHVFADGGIWSRDDRQREERPETEGVKIRWEPRRVLVPVIQPRNELFPPKQR